VEVDTTLVMEVEVQDTTLDMVLETQVTTLVMEVETRVTTLVMEVEVQDTTLVMELEAQAITLVLEVEIPDIIPDTTVLHLFQEMAIVTISVAADKSVEATEEIMEEVTGEVTEGDMVVDMEVVMDVDQADLCAKLGVMLLLNVMAINGNPMVEVVSPVLVLAGDMVTILDTHHIHHTHHTTPSLITLYLVVAG